MNIDWKAPSYKYKTPQDAPVELYRRALEVLTGFRGPILVDYVEVTNFSKDITDEAMLRVIDLLEELDERKEQ